MTLSLRTNPTWNDPPTDIENHAWSLHDDADSGAGVLTLGYHADSKTDYAETPSTAPQNPGNGDWQYSVTFRRDTTQSQYANLALVSKDIDDYYDEVGGTWGDLIVLTNTGRLVAECTLADGDGEFAGYVRIESANGEITDQNEHTVEFYRTGTYVGLKLDGTEITYSREIYDANYDDLEDVGELYLYFSNDYPLKVGGGTDYNIGGEFGFIGTITAFSYSNEYVAPADICTNSSTVLDNTQYAYLAAEVQTLAWCWKLVRQDNAFFGFTNHDRNIVYNGITYEAATGFVPTAVDSSGALSVDNLDVEGMLTSDRITEADLVAGKYDYAFVEVFLIDWAVPANAPLIVRRGRIGEVSLGDAGFKAEIRGLMQNLQQTFGQVYSVTCRATLGDARCGVALSGYTVTGTVSEATSRTEFDTALAQADGTFDFGRLTWTGGANSGYSAEVRSFASGAFLLYLPMPNAIAAGDTFSVIAGCDRKWSTCRAKFTNGNNFRGEPHVPGEDFAYSTASRKEGGNTVRSAADAGMR